MKNTNKNRRKILGMGAAASLGSMLPMGTPLFAQSKKTVIRLADQAIGGIKRKGSMTERVELYKLLFRPISKPRGTPRKTPKLKPNKTRYKLAHA